MIFLNPNEDMLYGKCQYSHEDTMTSYLKSRMTQDIHFSGRIETVVLRSSMNIYISMDRKKTGSLQADMAHKNG